MIPDQITAGDQVAWYDERFKDNIGNEIVPGGDYSLKYAIRGALTINKTATVEHGKWKTVLSGSDTSSLTSRTNLYWHAYAENGDGEKITLGQGKIEVVPSLVGVSSSSFDGRTQAEKDLEAVQAAIRALVSGGAVAEYTIGNRSIRKMALADLYMMESNLKFDVAQEKKAEAIRKGLGNPNNLYVRFK